MVIFLIFECFFSKRFFVLLFIQNIIVFTLPALIVFCVHHLVVFSQTNMFKLIESWKFQAFGFHKVASLNAKLEVNNRGVLGKKVILEMVAQNSQEYSQEYSGSVNLAKFFKSIFLAEYLCGQLLLERE